MKKFLHENRGLILFLVLFGLFRTAIADWNPIPSGSMRPTLLEGDVVFVNRIAYDLKLPLSDVILVHLDDPKRGDIVTFTSPADGKRLIKRLVALPGDRVEMRNKQLLINGQTMDYQLQQVVIEELENGETLPALRLAEDLDGRRHTVQWLSGVSNAANFGPLTIPSGQYLMLGDNRDNSADSRYIGLIPRNVLIGRAERVLVSAAIMDNWAPRTERFGQSLY